MPQIQGGAHSGSLTIAWAAPIRNCERDKNALLGGRSVIAPACLQALVLRPVGHACAGDHVLPFRCRISSVHAIITIADFGRQHALCFRALIDRPYADKFIDGHLLAGVWGAGREASLDTQDTTVTARTAAGRTHGAFEGTVRERTFDVFLDFCGHEAVVDLRVEGFICIQGSADEFGRVQTLLEAHGNAFRRVIHPISAPTPISFSGGDLR
jgi:hypothetical protein